MSLDICNYLIFFSRIFPEACNGEGKIKPSSCYWVIAPGTVVGWKHECGCGGRQNEQSAIFMLCVGGGLSRALYRCCSVSRAGLSCISLPSIITEFPFVFAFVPFSLSDPILSCRLFLLVLLHSSLYQRKDKCRKQPSSSPSTSEKRRNNPDVILTTKIR